VDFREPKTTIEGEVYVEGWSALSRPLVGAVIATNQGPETTTTDSHGQFTLRIRRIAPDEFVVVTASAAGKAAPRRSVGYGPTIQMNIVMR
jgi:hypothetical protein